jgi:NAD(P)-dependent dehydrogenase (short-subunit alcohol dehydrogenase family)
MAMVIDVLKKKWGTPPKESTESFAGRNVLVTGSSGLGYASAVKFAKLGASKIIITARDEAKGEATRSQLESDVGETCQFEVWQLDMNSYDSIVKLSQRAATELDHLDVAILNVGIYNTTYRPSKYGWEEDLQVNTLSTILLGILLLPKMKEAQKHTGKTPVLQFVNSGLHKTVEVSAEIRQKSNILPEFNKAETFSGGQKQYAYSKLFQRYATMQLAKANPSSEVIITSVCPGPVSTNIARDVKFPGVKIVTAIAHALAFRTPEQGANTYITGATQNQDLHGRFWVSDKIETDGQNIVGEESQQISLRVWNEIVEELAKHVPEVREHLS